MITRLLHNRSRGVTLIELLIVVAILSLGAGSFIGIHIYMMREQRHLSMEMETNSEEHQILYAVLRDVAQAERITLPSLGGVEASPQLATFIPQQPTSVPTQPTVAYRLEGERLQRVLTDRTTTQTLSNRIQTFSLERRGSLLHIAVACQRTKLAGVPEEPIQLLETDCYTGDKMP